MTVTALYPVLMTTDLDASKRFYQDLLELEPVFDSEWFTQLITDDGRAQMGLVADGHDSIPARFRGQTQTAALVTVEVEDASAAYERALAQGLPIELELRREDWGQLHFITRDPGGVAVDVVEVIPVTSPAMAAHYIER